MSGKVITGLVAVGLCVLLIGTVILGVSVSAAKRGKPAVIKPIEIAGVEYRAPNTRASQGVVEAWQNNRLLWKKKVYRSLWIPLLEEDNQWNFIKSMTIGSSTNDLLIANEEGAQFILNIVSRKVTRVKGSILRGW